MRAALRADGGGPVEEDAVSDALEQLADPSWGNLLAFPDSSRVTALEDFYRRRMLYQMSRPGEAAERALAQYDAALGTRGSLQSVALEDIVVLLTHLRDTVAEHQAGVPADAARTHQALRSLREAGCRYHGDFDWPGLRIAHALHQRIPWTQWRYTAADYVAVVEGTPLSRALAGRPALCRGTRSSPS